MKIKYLSIIIIATIIFTSCTKVEILTDSYWPYFVSDFRKSASLLKFQALFKGFKLELTVSNLENETSDTIEPNSFNSDIYLLSPLLSQQIDNFSDANKKGIFYYFANSTDFSGNLADKPGNSADKIVMIRKDRLESFYEAGELLNNKIKNTLVLPVIFEIDNNSLKEETQSFITGFESGKNKIIPFEISNTDKELDIRNIFENKVVQNSKYLAIFSNNWKKICLELAEKENKLIVTSDSWFYSSYKSTILFSVEDNIKGMLNKVYNSAKMEKLDDITLEGVILR